MKRLLNHDKNVLHEVKLQIRSYKFIVWQQCKVVKDRNRNLKMLGMS